MTETEQAHLASGALRSLYEKVRIFFEDHGLGPSTPSVAADDLIQFPRRESVVTLHIQASLLLIQGAEHLSAFLELTSYKTPSLAPSANARAIVENSALARWLFDSNIPIRRRVRRSLALRYADLIQQKKIVKARDKNTDITKIDQRIDAIEALSVELGFELIINKKGNRDGVGERMTPFTEIVKNEIDHEANYRVLSSLTHGNVSTLRQLGYQIIGDDRSDDGAIIEGYVSPLVILYMIHVVADAFSQAVEAKTRLFGWDIERLNRELNPLLRTLNSSVGN